jgi:hypothetical protein
MSIFRVWLARGEISLPQLALGWYTGGMDEWFCEIAGRQIGPLSSHQLKTMAANGQIVPTDKVRRGPTGHWVSASHVRGLFAAAQPPPQTAAEPPSFFGSTPPPTQVFANAATPNVAWPAETPAAPPVPEPPRPPELPTRDAPTDDSASFDFIAESDEVAPVGRNIKNRALLARARRKRQQQMLVAGSLIFVIFGLIIAVIFLFAGNFGSLNKVRNDVKKSGGLSGLSKKIQKAADEKPGDEDETRPSPSKAAERSDLTKTNKTADENPADTAGLRMVVGNVPVRVVSVVRGSDQADSAGSQCLLVTVEVKNPSPHDNLEFPGWSRDAALRGATLTDDQGKNYPIKSVNAAAVLGTSPPTSLAPSESARDVLCFERPGPKARSLQLELPGSAFGKDAAASFQIPAKMIADKPVMVKLGPSSGAKPQKSRQPKPGTPEYDFGIETEGEAPR